MSEVVYDAGVLVAADRNDRSIWAEHRARLEVGLSPVTTGLVVAQVSRSPRQAQLRRFLRGCDIVGFHPDQGHQVGALIERSGHTDVVDAHLAVTTANASGIVITSDPKDLQVLANHTDKPIDIVAI